MNRTILTVDDNETNLAILAEILEDEYDVVTAADGEEAIERCREHRPALVLLDAMMPKVDGFEACRRIKADPSLSRAQIVLVSAKATAGERVQGYEAGADDYIVKPFDDEELLAKVRVHLRLRDALDQLDAARKAVEGDNERLTCVVAGQEERLLRQRDHLVFSLAKLADSRDPETGEHLLRMREYCRELAIELDRAGPHAGKLGEAFVDAIYLAAPLHDVGKVGIPDAILLKPGRLSDDEFNLMKRHAEIGHDALSEVAGYEGVDHEKDGYLAMAVEIARWHHERWDGGGYPDKLAGDRIPLAARICAVADVFDALTSVRVYKAAFTAEVAKQMIVEGSGTQFDPAIVEAFATIFPRLAEIRRNVTDSAPSTPAAKIAPAATPDRKAA